MHRFQGWTGSGKSLVGLGALGVTVHTAGTKWPNEWEWAGGQEGPSCHLSTPDTRLSPPACPRKNIPGWSCLGYANHNPKAACICSFLLTQWQGRPSIIHREVCITSLWADLWQSQCHHSWGKPKGASAKAIPLLEQTSNKALLFLAECLVCRYRHTMHPLGFSESSICVKHAS